MPAKLLIPLDGSEGAKRAVDYVAQTFGQTPGVEVRLLHILAGTPPAFWDDGHILDDQEQQARQDLIDNWQQEQEKKWEGLFAQARDRLIEGGMTPEATSTKFMPKYFDVAEDILREADTEGYSTIVMGRRGLTGAQKVLLGSVSSKVVHRAKGIAVLIVD
ncbi:MAG: universal stress protein [Desulfobacteraceae bacterium]